MAHPTQPNDIARETFKQLATRRIAPTPQNYQRIYHEVAGTSPTDSNPATRLLSIVRDQAARHPETPGLRTLQRGLEQFDWDVVHGALNAWGDTRAAGGSSGAEFASAMREALRLVEVAHRGWTPARKRESLDRVLQNFANDVGLPAKLRALARSWAESGPDTAPDAAGAGATLVGGARPAGTLSATDLRAMGVTSSGPGATLVGTPAATAPGDPAEPDRTVSELRDLVAVVLESGVAPRLERYGDVLADVQAITRRVRDARSAADIAPLSTLMKQLWMKIEMRVEPDEELVDHVMRLLGLVVENLGELVDDDQWIQGQIDVLRHLVNQPVDLRTVREAERGFREVIYKQSQLRKGLVDAKQSMKALLNTFVLRLGQVTASTSDYNEKLDRYAARINGTDTLLSLQALVDELMADTRSMQLDMVRSRDEFANARVSAEAAELRVKQLESELERVSSQVREDTLTGVMNRRGYDDAIGREIARAERFRKPMCLAVIDIDNFKRLNDQFGHATGDAALVHLAKVMKHTVRPTDVIARYGGEEFVIILPDTACAEAVVATQRVQRALTRKFFMSDNERLLITFSAGVAEYRPGDTDATLFARADGAMYSAKQQGKNRVVEAS
ncbi:MAG: diguanylate cyclase [Burkholderiales bacterium]|jgi:diguanylate cyclase|nr:diguanylate cyclase [Burkholderiales bacterium]